jgi:hypothetical protein
MWITFGDNFEVGGLRTPRNRQREPAGHAYDRPDVVRLSVMVSPFALKVRVQPSSGALLRTVVRRVPTPPGVNCGALTVSRSEADTEMPPVGHASTDIRWPFSGRRQPRIGTCIGVRAQGRECGQPRPRAGPVGVRAADPPTVQHTGPRAKSPRQQSCIRLPACRGPCPGYIKLPAGRTWVQRVSCVVKEQAFVLNVSCVPGELMGLVCRGVRAMDRVAKASGAV